MKACDHRLPLHTDRLRGMCLLGAVAAILVLHVSSSRGAVYTGFKDAGDFDGSIASFEYVATTVVTHVAVWTGIDDGSNTQWYQAGWRQDVGEAPTLYLEWKDVNQVKKLVIGAPPPASSSDYSVSRNLGNVDLLAGNVLTRSVPWVEAVYCWASYLVELHNEGGGDKTPGTFGSQLPFAGCELRLRSPNNWNSAGLKYDPSSQSANGVASKSGNSFSVYDTRP